MNQQKVKIRVEHPCHHQQGFPWATPIGWIPKNPPFTMGSKQKYEVMYGALFSETDEVAGIVCFLKKLKEGSVVSVDLDDLGWVAPLKYRYLGLVELSGGESS